MLLPLQGLLLPVASLRQEAFRQEALNRPDPGEVLTRLNPLVKEQVTVGNFICFFFATWNPRTAFCGTATQAWILRCCSGPAPVSASR